MVYQHNGLALTDKGSYGTHNSADAFLRYAKKPDTGTHVYYVILYRVLERATLW